MITICAPGNASAKGSGDDHKAAKARQSLQMLMFSRITHNSLDGVWQSRQLCIIKSAALCNRFLKLANPASMHGQTQRLPVANSFTSFPAGNMNHEWAKYRGHAECRLHEGSPGHQTRHITLIVGLRSKKNRDLQSVHKPLPFGHVMAFHATT